MKALEAMCRAALSGPGSQQAEACLREHVPATHIPVAWHIADTLPITPSMKVDQPAVRRLFAEHVGN